jgi:hypothetical protein
MVLAFTPVPFSQGLIEVPGTPAVAPTQGVGQRLCLLWFLDRDPHALTSDELAAHQHALAARGLGALRFSGPFVPTVVGTDRYDRRASLTLASPLLPMTNGDNLSTPAGPASMARRS